MALQLSGRTESSGQVAGGGWREASSRVRLHLPGWATLRRSLGPLQEALGIEEGQVVVVSLGKPGKPRGMGRRSGGSWRQSANSWVALTVGGPCLLGSTKSTEGTQTTGIRCAFQPSLSGITQRAVAEVAQEAWVWFLAQPEQVGCCGHHELGGWGLGKGTTTQRNPVTIPPLVLSLKKRRKMYFLRSLMGGILLMVSRGTPSASESPARPSLLSVQVTTPNTLDYFLSMLAWNFKI